MAVVRALQPIPNQAAHTREDLFSVALGHAAINRLLHTPGGFMRVGWDDCRHLQGLGDAPPGASRR